MATTNYIVIPEEFRRSDNSYCSQCRAETNGGCGHFLDARDTYGPWEPMNWMGDGLPHGEARRRYFEWVKAHHSAIRYVQENPRYWERFSQPPDDFNVE